MGRKHRHRDQPRRRKTIPLDPEVASALERQREAFRRKFGRDPGPNDPVFFDPDADEPQELDLGEYDTAVIKAMVDADLDPALIWAYKRTGLLVTEHNRHLLSDDDLREWNKALAQYDRSMRGKPS